MLAGIEEEHRDIRRDAGDEVQQHHAFGAEARHDRRVADQPRAEHARERLRRVLAAEEIVETDDVGLGEARRHVDPVAGTIFGRGLHLSHASASRSARSEEHTSELQSLMRISYAVFCLKKKNTLQYTT